MISPTVGRKVWFYEHPSQPEPIDATIIKVWGTLSIGARPDDYVNLDVVDPLTGAHRCVTSVKVGDESTPYMHYRWMPYQMGQAAKAEAGKYDAAA